MNAFDASEAAYRNGYEAGKAEMEKEVQALREELEQSRVMELRFKNELKSVKDALERASRKNEKLEITSQNTELRSRALMRDVKAYQGAVCCYCKNLIRDEGEKKVYCKMYGEDLPYQCGNWEWRGIQYGNQ